MASSKDQHPLAPLRREAAAVGLEIGSMAFAQHLDAQDPSRRDEFHIPKTPANEVDPSAYEGVVYLCGNSLGLQPKRTRQLLQEELDVWADRGVLGHHDHQYGRPWVYIDDPVVPLMAQVVGAKHAGNEVAVMGSLTNNLHLLMVPFYRPTGKRYKIMIEEKAFPSDQYAVASQVRFHGYDPTDAVLQLGPRAGEHVLRPEDILAAIRDHGDEIALVLLSGVQYYTGQLFDIPGITRAARDAGCVVGWDLAHAVGNVPLELHDWGVDFAAWCSYKYLNSGPGCIAGIFVHLRHADMAHNHAHFAGWWGHNKQSRFDMPNKFEPLQGAAAFQLSNPSVVATVSLLGSLQVFAQTSMASLRARSLRLTAYLEHLLTTEIVEGSAAAESVMHIITPADPAHRGAQLSLLFPHMASIDPLMRGLMRRGVVVDERNPNVLRVAPAPLYNTFADVRRFVGALKAALGEIN